MNRFWEEVLKYQKYKQNSVTNTEFTCAVCINCNSIKTIICLADYQIWYLEFLESYQSADQI